MFDRGLISIADNHDLLFAKGKVADSVMRIVNAERRLLAPTRLDQAPHPMFLRWHRENVFKG
jgi:putative restriction endonuclease